MAITTTAKLGLPQWGLGSDSPSRTAFNSAFAAIDAKVALDLGEVGSTTLPATDVVAGRYASVVNGSYRQLFRRNTAGWVQVGGNMWPETVYTRAPSGTTATALARQVSHADLANPTIVENWDGSSLRGGRQQIGDVNTGTPGALHVGDTTSTVDLLVRGRVFARTTATGHRGFVASAHAADAGNLFTAIESGGSATWLVDSLGRMRAQAATAFGAAALTTGVPFASTPGAADATAMDLTAAAGKPALRLYRAAGDSIGSVLPDSIALGKAGWTGGVISLTAPTLTLAGALGVTGATTISGNASITGTLGVGSAVALSGTLGVSGATTLAGLSAGATTVTGTLGVSGATTLAGLSAGATTVGGTLNVSGATTLAGLSAGTTGVGALTATGATISGAATISGDLYASSRLRLSMSQPSGTASGQVRIASDYALEVYDGSTWRRTTQFGSSTSWKHGWAASGQSVGGADVYVQATGFTTEQSGSFATMSSGDLKLNKAGLWSLRFSFYNDSPFDGDNRMEIRWDTGAFPGRDTMRDIRTRQSGGIAGAGSGECCVTWVGYVTTAQAAQSIEMWVAQRGGSGGNASTATGCVIAAEYLSA